MGEIAEVVGGGTPRTNDSTNFEGGDVPWITPADLSGYAEKYISAGARFITRKGLESSSARLLPAGTVLFTSRAPIGYVAIASNPVATNQGFKSFVLKDGVLPEYVYWWLKGSKQRAEALASGTTFLELSGASAKKLPIPIAPIDEQRRIVAEIEKQSSRLDEAVANLKRVKANLYRYKAAVLKAAVEGRLVPTEADLARHEGRSYESGTELLQRIVAQREAGRGGTAKRRPPADPDTSQLPSVPAGWVYCSVSQVCDVASGNTPAGVFDAVRPNGALPWFKVGDMNHSDNQQVMHHADSWLSESDARALGLRIFPPRTLLFPKRGGAIATNKKRVLDRPGCADLNVMGITPCEVVDDYFRVWFDSVDLGKLSDGSNVPQINHKDIDPLPLPLPPRGEQQRIVAEVDQRLSIVREVEAEVDANLKRAQALRRAVPASAFRVQ
jgi:type I restriction enzyme S subunit